MPSQIIDIPSDSVVQRLASPSFSIGYPPILHADRIPPAVLEKLERSWKQGRFSPQEVTVSRVRDVFVAAEGLVFASNLDLYRSSITGHSQAEIERSRKAVMDGQRAGCIASISGTVMLCKKRGAHNYGHWMIEMLPKAFLLRRLGQHETRVLVQATSEPLAEVMRQSLERIAIREADIVKATESPVHVDELLMVDGMTAHGSYMSPLVMECTDEVAGDIPPGGGERILVLREGMKTRRFVDEGAIRGLAERAGYLVVNTERLSFLEQIACFKGAKKVVGVMGAAMTNIAFSPRGSDIVTLSPESMSDTFFWFLSGLRDQHYTEVRCRQIPPVRGPMPWDTDLLLSPNDKVLLFGGGCEDKPHPNHVAIGDEMSESSHMDSTMLPELRGMHYLKFLEEMHGSLQPRSYLEVGTRSGDSLALANCPSIAIDPQFRVNSDVIGKKPQCLLFQCTSDDYFATQNPASSLRRPIDLAFLDGLHHFEFLLRDFINTEKHCSRQSIIAMHDCIPTDVFIAERDDNPERRRAAGSKPGWWAGDVWKIIPILRQWRPDITLLGLDCAPTGLLLATGLNPESRVLSDNYTKIVEQFSAFDLAGYGLERFHAEVNLQSAAAVRLPFQL